MRYYVLIFMVTVIGALPLKAQEITPQKLGFTPYTINDKSLGEVNYYVSSNKIDETKPILLYLDGSGALPLFQYTERGIGSSVVIDFRKLSETYHVILISKPGIPFIDSVKTDDATGIPVYDAPPVYREKLSLEWRVNSAQLVLQNVMKKLPVNKDKIAALGISEGFQVGAKLATVEPKLTHLVLLVGNGLNQFYDFVIQNRLDAQQGFISADEAQQNIDSIYQVAAAIYADPTSTTKEWYGHTYLRWSSFTASNPTDHILSLDIPVYIVAASEDRNTSVLGTDYLYLESIRRGKTNVVYTVYPYDHSFTELITDETGNVVSASSHLKEVVAEALNWLAGQ